MDAPKMKVVVVGSANVDLTARVDAMPRPGETILGSDLMSAIGGKGANQAAAAAKLGADVAFVGCRGEDQNGDLIEAALLELGVSLSEFRTFPGPSGVALIMLTEDGENSIIVSPGANKRLTSGQVHSAAAGWTANTVVAVQLECPQEPISAAVRAAVQTGSRVIINAAPARKLPSDVIAAANPLVVNESESDFYLGETGRTAVDPQAAVRELIALGAQSVVVTVGADGAHLGEWRGHDELHITHIPGVPARAVDTTGAGDAFVGALAAGVAIGQSVTEAAELAVRVGAFAVEHLGAQSSYPTLAEVQKRH